MEQRKIDYLLEKAKIDLRTLDKRFEEIDDKMLVIKKGRTVYIDNEIDCGFFVMTVTKIINKDQGIIEICYQGQPNRTQVKCVTSVCLYI